MKLIKTFLLVLSMGGVLALVAVLARDGGVEANLNDLVVGDGEVVSDDDVAKVTVGGVDGDGQVAVETAEGIKIAVVNEKSQCSDGVDNDGDGVWDFGYDEGCSSPEDDSEAKTVLPECSDGVDNDGDGVWDFGYDEGCSSPADKSELS